MKLELCNIVKSFGNTRVLDDISVTVPEGGTLIITGASGVGKTTLVSIILGILKPDSGSVTPGSYRCSPVFQEDRLIENLSPADNIKIICPSLDRETIVSELSKVLPPDAADKPVSELSGGMKRRTAVVRACLHDSDILVMDEPLSGLDSKNRQNMLQYISVHRQNRILVITAHEDHYEDLFADAVVLPLDR